jgi:hypothetical protein
MGAALERMGRFPEALVSMKTVLSLSTVGSYDSGCKIRI